MAKLKQNILHSVMKKMCWEGGGRERKGEGGRMVNFHQGRLDVMGGIGDYSGCMVLQLPIREGTFVALQVGEGGTERRGKVREGGRKERGIGRA